MVSVILRGWAEIGVAHGQNAMSRAAVASAPWSRVHRTGATGSACRDQQSMAAQGPAGRGQATGGEIYHERHEIHEECESGYDPNFVFFVYFVVKASLFLRVIRVLFP